MLSIRGSKERRGNKKGLREFVDRHPAATAIVLVFVSASATATILIYLHGRDTNLLNSAYRAELAQVRTEMGNANRALKEENSDLITRMASIERGIEGDTVFFDITKLSIPSDTLRTLSESYRPFQDGKFFVNTPNLENWKHEKTTEGAFMEEQFGRELFHKMLPQAMITQLNNADLDIWRHTESLEFVATLRAIGSAKNKGMKIPLYPHIKVQAFTKRQLQDAVSSFLEPDSYSKILDEFSETNTQDQEFSIPELKTVDTISSALESLSNAMFDDVTGILLMSILQQGYMFATLIEDSRFKVLSAQKKGNVLYLKAQIILQGSWGSSTNIERVILDREYFVIGTGQEFILIEISVPSQYGQHEAFQWVSTWLTGLRIPL